VDIPFMLTRYVFMSVSPNNLQTLLSKAVAYTGGLSQGVQNVTEGSPVTNTLKKS